MNEGNLPDRMDGNQPRASFLTNICSSVGTLIVVEWTVIAAL